MTTEVTRQQRTFQVRVYPDNGNWSYEVTELVDGHRMTREVGRGYYCMTRWSARWAARHAIRCALKGEEHWTVTAERQRG